MTVEVFCEKYGVAKDTVYVAKSTKRLPSHLFTKVKGSHVLIDELYFKRRYEFNKKVIQFNQSMFYFLSEHFSVKQLAEHIHKTMGKFTVHSIGMYFYYDLFALNEKPITNTKLTGMSWAIFRYNRKVVAKLNKKFNIKFDVEYILDRRMYSVN